MSFKITKQTKLPDSEYEIEGEIHADVVKTFRDKAVKELALETRVDGFRPGHAPEKFVVDRFGEVAITEEAGRIALEANYGEIMKKGIDDKDIKPLGSPAVTITKVAPGEAFGFKIKTALMPEVKVKGYKAAAKKIMSEKSDIKVTDKEIEEAIVDLQRQVAHTEHHQANPDDHGHDHGDLPLPEVNADFIKKFGPFETVEAFKEKVKEGITVEKTRKEKDKKRLSIMEELIKTSEITMPKMLVESELGKMVHEMSANISQMGLTSKHILSTLVKLSKSLRLNGHQTLKSEQRLSLF